MRRVVEAAPDAGVGILTLFAFSSDNWRRPAEEVDALMRMMAIYLEQETRRCVEQGVRLEVIGRRDRLGAALQRCHRARGGGHRGGRAAVAADRGGLLRARRHPGAPPAG